MHAIDPNTRFLTKFPAHTISLKGQYHYSPLLSSVNLHTILLQIRASGACDCGQVNHPARQSALGTQARRRVASRPRAAEKCEVVEEIPVFGRQLLGLMDYCLIWACFATRDDMHKV